MKGRGLRDGHAGLPLRLELHVYEKCDDTSEDSWPRLGWQHERRSYLPNVGQECYAYLHYLRDLYHGNLLAEVSHEQKENIDRVVPNLEDLENMDIGEDDDEVMEVEDASSHVEEIDGPGDVEAAVPPPAAPPPPPQTVYEIEEVD